MKLCAYFDNWPPTDAPSRPKGVTDMALPWSAVARHVSHRDVSGDAFSAALAAEGLTLRAVELPPLTCGDVAAFERETDDSYMRMQIVERLGAPLAVIASAHCDAAGHALMLDALTRLAALAERMDLQLAVRNTCGGALEQPAALDELFHHIGSTALGFCLDVGEFDRAVVNPAEIVLRFGDRLAAVIIPDSAAACARVPDAHVSAVMEELAQERYAGPLITRAGDVSALVARYGERIDS